MFASVTSETESGGPSHPTSRATRPTPLYKRHSDGRERAVVSAWVDASQAVGIDRLAAVRGETRSALVREAVQEYLAARAGFAAVVTARISA